MEKFFINGGKKLFGKIKVDGAKNSLLPVLAATIMVDGEVRLKNVPKYTDVMNMCVILEYLGVLVRWQQDDLILDASKIEEHTIPTALAGALRSSIFALGPLLCRHKIAKVAYPGGCEIGLRPIDLHLSGLRTLGTRIVEKNGYIYANGESMEGCDIILDFSSVGATENLMMAGVLTKGITRIFNPAKEPEIVDLADFLNACGAKVEGAGTSMIYIEGVEKLHGCEFEVIPDRIAAGTYLLMCAMCGGEVEIEGFLPYHNQVLLAKLCQTACQIDIKDDKIKVKSEGTLDAFGEVETAVYPGLPTDLQPQIMALQAVSHGFCLIVENLFEARFKHVPELIKMGADIRFRSNVCVIKGKDKLYGAEVNSPDLRGGVALVMAGMKAEGYTTISGIELIDRGYYKLEEKLSALGVDIKRIDD